MNDLPSLVVSELINRRKLPEDILELIYLLLQREEKDEYRTLEYQKEYASIEQLCVAYIEAIDSILSRLPPLRNQLTTTIGDLAGIAPNHILSLNKTRYYGFYLSDAQYFKERELANAKPYGIWKDILSFRVGFDLFQASRYQHTFILGQTGSGKTELIKKLITHDLDTTAALIVMAPKGNLIPDIERLGTIDSDRLILVHPDNPIALNLFDMKGDVNNVVGLINYVFSSILDAETTSKQTSLLNYCIRLLLAAKGTILDLRTLMKSEKLPEEYELYLPQLSDNAQEFFAEQFANKKTYGETKDQILWRLDLLLENTIVEQIFSQPKTTLDMNSVMAGGKILLVDTSIKSLGDMGSSFLGRFFIALVSLATVQRDTSKPLRPVYFYIDEASLYLDEKIEGLLERARESKLGLTIATQQLSQLRKVSPNLEASVLTNTGTKFVGACSHDDATRLSHALQVDATTLEHQPNLNFYLHSKGLTKRAISIPIPAGHMDKLPKRTDEELAFIVEENRARYVVNTRPPKKTAPPKQAPQQSAPIPDDDIESLNKS